MAWSSAVTFSVLLRLRVQEPNLVSSTTVPLEELPLDSEKIMGQLLVAFRK